jgi:hypothetical protein
MPLPQACPFDGPPGASATLLLAFGRTYAGRYPGAASPSPWKARS